MNDGNAVVPGFPRRIRKPIDVLLDEPHGNVLLPDVQDVHGVSVGLLEGWQAAGASIEAEEDQGRVERYRRKGIRSQSNRVAGRIRGGDDGDTGTKAAKRLSKGQRIDAEAGRTGGGTADGSLEEADDGGIELFLRLGRDARPCGLMIGRVCRPNFAHPDEYSMRTNHLVKAGSASAL